MRPDPAEIERIARMSQGDDRPHWLDDVLQSYDLDPEAGILVEYDEVEDQGATLCHGTWLTTSREFWSFEVWVREDGSEPRVEVVENITTMTSLATDIPGIGKSFGAVALDVLGTVLPGRPH